MQGTGLNGPDRGFHDLGESRDTHVDHASQQSMPGGQSFGFACGSRPPDSSSEDDVASSSRVEGRWVDMLVARISYMSIAFSVEWSWHISRIL